jgi:hypothetical protein
MVLRIHIYYKCLLNTYSVREETISVRGSACTRVQSTNVKKKVPVATTQKEGKRALR